MLQNAHPVDTRHTRSKLTQVTKSLSLTRRSARWPWRQSSSAWWFVSRWPSCTDCMCVLDWCRHLLWHPFPRIGGEDAQICTMNAHATSLQTLLCCAIIVFPFPTQFWISGCWDVHLPGGFQHHDWSAALGVVSSITRGGQSGHRFLAMTDLNDTLRLYPLSPPSRSSRSPTSSFMLPVYRRHAIPTRRTKPGVGRRLRSALRLNYMPG